LVILRICSIPVGNIFYFYKELKQYYFTAHVAGVYIFH